jgi:hypothetical protein
MSFLINPFAFAVAGGDFESIATVTVGSGGAANIEFTSIPATFAHLQIRYVGRATTADTSSDLKAQINSDTGSNYADHHLAGNGSSASAFGESSVTLPFVVYRGLGAGTSGANVFGAGVIDILDYASTSKTKTVRALGGHDRNGAGVVVVNSLLWNSTSAITSIKLTPTADNFAQYSTAALYGVKAP